MKIFEDEIKKLKENDTFRQIGDISKKEDKYIFVNNQKYLNLSSNDYLGLSTNKELVKKFVAQNLENPEFLFSSASARLLSGSSQIYKKLEKRLASLFKKEKALIFNTGYQCNLGVVSSFAQKHDVIFCDKLNHASIIDGIKLSGADFYRYRHLDYDHLEELLEKQRGHHQKALIISESVFSMDGDIADIKRLTEIKKRHDAVLMIDEAHAFGAFGENLCGISEQQNVLNDVDIITATLGKSLASTGAFVVSQENIIDYFVNKARSFIFSTSLPSLNIMWSEWLLSQNFDLLKAQKHRLNEVCEFALNYLEQKEISTPSSSQIIPIVLGDNKKALEMSKFLQENGYFILPIRPPSVAPKSSRIRLSLNSQISKEEIKNVINLISEKIK